MHSWDALLNVLLIHYYFHYYYFFITNTEAKNAAEANRDLISLPPSLPLFTTDTLIKAFLRVGTGLNLKSS